MARKKKILPRNFMKIIKSGNMEDFVQIFEEFDINAFHRHTKMPALGYLGLTNEMIAYLIESGADINAVDIYGNTPLHNHSRFENISFLIKYYDDVNLENNAGFTPLHFAVENKNVNAVLNLLKKGININVRGGYNRMTAFEYAFECCTVEDIAALKDIADIFINEGGKITEDMKISLADLREKFLLNSDDFDIVEYEYALRRLYKMAEMEYEGE